MKLAYPAPYIMHDTLFCKYCECNVTLHNVKWMNDCELRVVACNNCFCPTFALDDVQVDKLTSTQA